LGAGKILCILGGIVALLATLFFSFYSFEILSVEFVGFGLGIFLNFGTIFESGEILAIIFSIIYAIGVISGILILIGAKSRVLAIIGSIFALILGIILLLVAGLEISLGADIDASTLFFVQDPFVDGILPFDLPIGLGSMSLGTLLLVAGGALGLIGGILGPGDF
jgi:hypothetical protein